MMKANVAPSPLHSEDAAEERPARIPAHGKGVLRPFQPGRSGNPSGKGGLYHEAQRLCREASPAAARRLIALMGSDDERVALMAADKVLERAWGKPKEMADEAELDPVIEERRSAARAEVYRLLDRLAVPEPLDQGPFGHTGKSQGHRQPGRAAGDSIPSLSDDQWPE